MATIVRTKNRVYETRRRTFDDTGEWYDVRHMVSNAEYAVMVGDKARARIIRNGRKWICCELGSGNGFGKAISPMNAITFDDVKRWALKKWGGV